jgi:hypothetical protein
VASPVLLQKDFKFGMKPDVPSDALAEGTVRFVQDFLPAHGAPLEKRGGWAYHHGSVGQTSLHGIGLWESTSWQGSRLLVSSQNNTLFTVHPVTGAAAVAGAIGFSELPIQPFIFYRGNVIIQGSSGPTPTIYNGTTTAVSTIPPSKVGVVFKDRLVVATGQGNPHRLWVSEVGDIGAWNTGANGRWVDFQRHVEGMIVLKNQILVFHEGLTQRVTFDIPWGVQSSDAAVQPLFPVGITVNSARCLATNGDVVCFANPSGVYMTDGLELVDLTRQGDMKRYWQNLNQGRVATDIFTGAIYNGVYYITFTTNGVRYAFGVNLETRAWYRFTNFPFSMMLTAESGRTDIGAELFATHATVDRTVRLSPIFTPSSANVNDGDGTEVRPRLITPFYRGTHKAKRIRRAYVTYEMFRTGATPTLEVRARFDPETLFSSMPAHQLPESATHGRYRAPINQAAYGFALQLVPSVATDYCRVYALEAELDAREGSR